MPSFKLGPEMKIRTRQFYLSMPRLSGIRCASAELLARTNMEAALGSTNVRTSTPGSTPTACQLR